jgi:DMSO/TMAO reductase YedYZ molybdopterin-dependent catalytic subunit
VGGLVANPRGWSLDELRGKPARSQITRHDCVEGWSAIGKWTGVPLGTVLDEARLSPEARYIVFRCADDFSGTPYYESIDLVDAFHPQTILAYGMNDGDLPVGHGAPIRLRVERQLGYKHAKFIMGIKRSPRSTASARARAATGRMSGFMTGTPGSDSARHVSRCGTGGEASDSVASYRFVEPDLQDLRRRFPRLMISFKTVHASKGLGGAE